MISNTDIDYSSLQNCFERVLDKHVPMKNTYPRANDGHFMCHLPTEFFVKHLCCVPKSRKSYGSTAVSLMKILLVYDIFEEGLVTF